MKNKEQFIVYALAFVLIVMVVGIFLFFFAKDRNQTFTAQDLTENTSCIQMSLFVDGSEILLSSPYCMATIVPTPIPSETPTLAPTLTSEPTSTETATLEPTITATATITPTNTVVVIPTDTLEPTPSDFPANPGWFVVDSSNLWLFDQIPTEYIVQASNLSGFFQDRATADEISNYLDCMAFTTADDAPVSCKRPDPVTAGFTGLIPDPIYNRSNIIMLNSTSDLAGFMATDLSSYHMYGFIPHNTLLNANGGGDDLLQATFFTNLRGLEPMYEGVEIYFTPLLSRQNGTEYLRDFAEATRAFAASRNVPLIDLTDILSTRPDGSRCLLGAYPIICETYTTQINGGSLGSHSAGGLRIGKAFWIMKAVVAGWRPDVMPPTPMPTSTQVYPPPEPITPVPSTPVTPYP